MFSIIIPTYNNINLLKICINSLKKNSKFNNEIIVHVNVGNDNTKDYLINENIKYTHTDYNSGLCVGVNLAAKKAKFDYIIYSHDDFYFCPKWDLYFYQEIQKIGHNRFYLSGSAISNKSIACGQEFDDFNEDKLLKNYKNYTDKDLQGSTWAPHVIHKFYWNKVKGFSEEYFPGAGSDPDLNMKLWNCGIRIFKELSSSKVYHFGSKTLRKNKNNYGSKSSKIFLLKWGISIKFFKKHYLKSKTIFNGELKEPKKTFTYLTELILLKIYYVYLYILTYINDKSLINETYKD